MTHQKMKPPPGTEMRLFPGNKVQAKTRSQAVDLGTLKAIIQRKAVEHGPDHPEVRLLRRELADRQRAKKKA